MFGSAAIDVALGLAFVYLILSVICAQVNEWIAALFDLRARDLERGLHELLTDNPLVNDAEPSDLAIKVWNHPLLLGLWPRGGKRPSYVPSKTFALAVFDALGEGAGNDLAAVRAGAVALSAQDGVGHAIRALIDAAEGEGRARLVSARANVAAWFDESMDRVSGVYKRRMQWITPGVTAVLVLLVGVDSIALANALWINQEARAAIAGSASASAAAQLGFDEALDAIGSFALPLGWSDWPADAYGWGLKFVGLLVTVLAVSLGAPFWFDVLKRVSNLRSAGPAPKPADASAAIAQTGQ